MRRHTSILRSARSRLMQAAAGLLAVAGVAALAGAALTEQATDHDAMIRDLNALAAKAQQYYKTQGNSSFTGFALTPDDTGNVNGSYGIYEAGGPPAGAAYVPGSTAPATAVSAQTLYILGCGKDAGKDGTDPIKAYVSVDPGGSTIVELN